MKKTILLILFFAINCFAFETNSFLEPKDAFKTDFTKTKNELNFNLKLADNIYLYADKVKVFITKPQKIDITKDIKLAKPEAYHEFIVYFKGIDIKIPHTLLKSKLDSSKYEVEVKFQGCSTQGLCYAPMKKKHLIELNSIKKETKKIEETTNNENLSETDFIANSLKNDNTFLVLATFFGFGLLLSLTPCVFPMIPILSSIIVGASSKEEMTAKKGFFLSLIYVLSMSIAYTIAGVVAGLFGANLQVALQNPWVLSIFAFIFVALAFSMFGYYKLELPQSLQNRINKTTDGKEKQGIAGIAIMGFLSALIVGPCVAPPLAGALIYIGQTGDAILGGLALFVLSLGMGVPLLLIGLGAGKLLPKAGAWMDNVSKIFGIVMLGVAIWLLDRVINPTLSIYLWSLLLLGTSLYLKEYKHILAKLLSIATLIYGVSSFVGAVSGATNPLNPLEKFTQKYSSHNSIKAEELAFKSIKSINDLENEIKNSKKPIMLDFYADWCISCKELDNITFKDSQVIEKLKGFTLLRVDVTNNTQEDKALQKKFNIVGPPALIFWQDKKELKSAKIVGYKNPKEFLKILNNYFK